MLGVLPMNDLDAGPMALSIFATKTMKFEFLSVSCTKCRIEFVWILLQKMPKLMHKVLLQVARIAAV